MASSEPSVTSLLQSLREGEEDAFDALFPIVYQQLRTLARKVRQGRASDTVNTTALVHEAYLKLVGHGDWESRLHFLRTAAKAMRQILIGAAREKLAAKRGGDMPNITFDEQVYSTPMKAEKLVALDEALEGLHHLDPRMAQVVECRYFAGLSIDETAAALRISPRTVKRDWRTARAYLAEAMQK